MRQSKEGGWVRDMFGGLHKLTFAEITNIFPIKTQITGPHTLDGDTEHTYPGIAGREWSNFN